MYLRNEQVNTFGGTICLEVDGTLVFIVLVYTEFPNEGRIQAVRVIHTYLTLTQPQGLSQKQPSILCQ